MFGRSSTRFILAISAALTLGLAAESLALGSPRIEITSLPPYGVWGGDLEGRTWGADPAEQRVAVYLFIPGVGWWTKPYYTERCTQIRWDGTWSVLVTTGGVDHLATLFAAFLIPNAACYDDQIIADGDSCLPEAVYQAALDYDIKRREDPNQRRISFSGYEWLVKSSAGTTIGPGPNYFSDDTSNVWVDQLGRLHLRITYRNGKWNCAEVIARRSLGYGTYRFYLDSRVDDLDPGVVLGLFTYSDECPAHLDGCISAHREMDFEFTRWGDPNNPQNAQFVVQEWDCAGHLERFTMPAIVQSTHQFRWMPESVWFQSSVGHSLTPPPSGIMHQWMFSKPGEVPVPGLEQCRMNLYLVNGMPPINGLEREVVIRRFEYIPCRPPMDVSLTPASGMFAVGTKYTFASKYSDPDGHMDLANCYLLINTSANQSNSVFLRYDANTNLLYVKNDDNTDWGTGRAPGSAYVLENNYCRLHCAETTRSVLGNTLTVNWKIEFKPGLSGKTCGAWMLVYDDLGLRDGWEQVGSNIKVSRPPANANLAPNGGPLAVDAKVTLTSRYSDPDGNANLANCYLLINTTLDPANAVFLRYDQNANLLYLKNDANTDWGVGRAPASAYTLENSQCEVYCAETTVSASGTSLTVNWRIEFKLVMSGSTCGAWMLVYDDAGLRDGYDQMGGFSISQTPLNVSLSPSGGALPIGTWFTLTGTYSDPDGAEDLANCYLLLNTSLNQANAVFVRYDANANKLYLKNDANTAWTGGYAPGAVSAIHNTQCILSCSGTTVTPSGNSLIIGWRLYLKAPMAHKTLPAWMLLYDDAGLRDGYDRKGSFTTP